MNCECINLPDVVCIPMGRETLTFNNLERVAVCGEPIWWLSLSRCPACATYWLVGNEKRINDDYYLKRLNELQADKILNVQEWPSDFSTYAELLRLGKEFGHSVSYCDPENSIELLSTVVELARESPGISTSELCVLLPITPRTSIALAKQAIAEGAGIAVVP